MNPFLKRTFAAGRAAPGKTVKANRLFPRILLLLNESYDTKPR